MTMMFHAIHAVDSNGNVSIDVFNTKKECIMSFHNPMECVRFFHVFANASMDAFGEDEMEDAWDALHEQEDQMLIQ